MLESLAPEAQRVQIRRHWPPGRLQIEIRTQPLEYLVGKSLATGLFVAHEQVVHLILPPLPPPPQALLITLERIIPQLGADISGLSDSLGCDLCSGSLAGIAFLLLGVWQCHEAATPTARSWRQNERRRLLCSGYRAGGSPGGRLGRDKMLPPVSVGLSQRLCQQHRRRGRR